MRRTAALALALAGTALAGCSTGAGATADSAAGRPEQSRATAPSSPAPSPAVSPTPSPTTSPTTSPVVTATPSPTPSAAPSAASTSAAPAPTGRYDAAAIVRHLHAQDAGGGTYLYMTPDGLQCEISSVLTSRSQVSKSQAAGADLATTPDGSAGVSITADDLEPCRNALTQALSSL